MSRTSKAAKNALYGIMTKIIMMLLAFAARTVFIYSIGTTYLGVNGLYAEIIRILSFTELGFGTAMTFAMYKPVADEDLSKIRRLLRYYRNVLRSVACIVALLGLLVLPFLPYIVRGADFLSLRELRMFFLIILFNTVISYFCTYKFIYLNAQQKTYVLTNIAAVIQSVVSVGQIILLLFSKSFLAYLLIESAVLLFSRAAISLYLRRICPELNDLGHETLRPDEKQPIIKNIKGLVVHRLAGIAVHSTDNILISMLTAAGVVTVGFVSNYQMVIRAVTGMVTRLIDSTQAGFGNLSATESDERFHRVFLELNFLTFWIYGFCACVIFSLLPSFVTLWIGKDKLIDTASFALIMINMYITGQESAFYNARIAKGDFRKDQFWAALQAAVNLVVSVAAAQFLGLVGIYIGTVVSRLIYSFNRPRTMYRFLFGTSSLVFYKRWFQYLGATLLAACVSSACTAPLLRTPAWGRFLLAFLIAVIVPNILFLLLFSRSNEFRALWQRLKNFILSTRKKAD